jgi:hypothetical protein
MVAGASGRPTSFNNQFVLRNGRGVEVIGFFANFGNPLFLWERDGSFGELDFDEPGPSTSSSEEGGGPGELIFDKPWLPELFFGRSGN